MKVVKLITLVHAQSGRNSGVTNSQTGGATNRNQNGVNGRAANGQSLRRQNGESMGQYLRRTGEFVGGATAKTRGKPARVIARRRG